MGCDDHEKVQQGQLDLQNLIFVIQQQQRPRDWGREGRKSGSQESGAGGWLEVEEGLGDTGRGLA